jgi:histidinol-phosphate phosphatase family protein
MNSKPLKIDKSWSLFLDRDGVINKRLPSDYVKSVSQFQFEDGSLKAIEILSRYFGKIVVVSNQQGIGKGLMSMEDLELINAHLIDQVKVSGGRIDKIYVSPYLESARHFSRKPSVGMGIQARKDFREISFRRSVMVGDSMSDMIFGNRLGMKTVFIGDSFTISDKYQLTDYCYPTLLEFAESIQDS